jgi:hypothetical protein
MHQIEAGSRFKSLPRAPIPAPCPSLHLITLRAHARAPHHRQPVHPCPSSHRGCIKSKRPSPEPFRADFQTQYLASIRSILAERAHTPAPHQQRGMPIRCMVRPGAWSSSRKTRGPSPNPPLFAKQGRQSSTPSLKVTAAILATSGHTLPRAQALDTRTNRDLSLVAILVDYLTGVTVLCVNGCRWSKSALPIGPLIVGHWVDADHCASWHGPAAGRPLSRS